VRTAADELLRAFARSDLDVIARRCVEDVVLWGTDEGESWTGRDRVLAAFDGAFDLRVRWLRAPHEDDNWLAGIAEFTLDDGSTIPVRVTMVFRGELLAHAHYSLAAKG
jgi:hypothetical protein